MRNRASHRLDDSAWAKISVPRLGRSRARVRMTRTGSIFLAAAAAKQKRQVSVVALGKKPLSVNYFGPITAHNEGLDEPRNTSSCCGISPSLVQPDGVARDEKARAGSEGGRRFCFYLICPERERERGAMGGRAVASAAISWDPTGYFSSIPTERCTVIDA